MVSYAQQNAFSHKPKGTVTEEDERRGMILHVSHEILVNLPEGHFGHAGRLADLLLRAPEILQLTSQVPAALSQFR
jgi:hypothetical protein